MSLCCFDITVGVRVVAVLGLVAAALVVMEMTKELAEGVGDGGKQIAGLLGLGVGELESRQRHAPHPPHLHTHGRNGRGPQLELLSQFDREVLIGFLVFAIAYGVSSGLLAYGSVVLSRWAAAPWLACHALSFTSLSARLVVQVAQRSQQDTSQRHATLQPHPYHDEPTSVRNSVTWHLDSHDHDGHVAEDGHQVTIAQIATSAIYLVVLVYMWLVVLVAQKEWSAARKVHKRRPARGDDDYFLATSSIKQRIDIATSTV